MSDPPRPPVQLDAELFDNINAMIAEFNNQKEILCDKKCLEDRKVTTLFQSYQDWAYLEREAPDQRKKAERDYYEADKGTIWYGKFREKRATKEASKIIPVLANNLEDKNKEIQRNISYYNSQMVYIKRMNDLLEVYSDQLATDERKIKDIDSKRSVANRLATYYNVQKTGISYYIKYIYILYWIVGVVTVGVVAFNLYKGRKQSKSKTEAGTVLVALVGYFVLPFLLRGIIQRFNPAKCN